MDYYLAFTNNEIGSFVEMWTGLEPVIQSEVRKTSIILYYILVGSRKMALLNLFAGQE